METPTSWYGMGTRASSSTPNDKRIYAIHSSQSQTNEVDVTNLDISFLFALISSNVRNHATTPNMIFSV